ncbi:hypothetical protein CBR_g29555 [Chara braunii]|uniref:Uncharacterized protein n=1 Tax=Chara braunii TaxID=69332 RepID=A0A388LAR7_CHABU|nr:hypothetical protein CBR_g29555 [Chara braunii]|eukprot:GBG79408.1 hypothetical protein CBR_g29555 [Chara braunii]
MLSFHRGAVEGMQGQAMGVPSGPGKSMSRMQSMIARPRLPLRPAPQSMPVGAGRTLSDQSASMIDVDSDDNGELPADTTGWMVGGVGDGEDTWHDDTGGSSHGADEGDDDDGTSTQPREMNDEDGGRRVEEGGGQGRPGEDVNAAKGNQQKHRGGRPPTTNPKPKVPWTLDERIHLARMMQEDDALMADANGQHRMMPMKDWYAWVTNMMTTAKLILDKQQKKSGEPSYFDITIEERRERKLSLSFEKALWDTMTWKLDRPSIQCDNTMASESLPGKRQEPSPTVGSDATGTEKSDSSNKARRTGTGKARVHEGGSGGSSLGKVMEDSTRSYCQGLDNAASALARATTGAGTAIAARIVRVNDVHAMDITAGLGFDSDGALSHVLLFVTKRHEVVPNRWEGPHWDAVGDTIKFLVFAIAEEFENSMDNTPWYDTIFDPPLEGRGYLHGLVDTWWDPSGETVAKRTVGGDVVGGWDVGDDDDDELYDDGDDDDDDDTSSSPSSSLPSSNSSSPSSSTQSSSTSQPSPTSSLTLHSRMKSMDNVRAEYASQSGQ